jgi:hypothetical protein
VTLAFRAFATKLALAAGAAAAIGNNAMVSRMESR